MNQRIDKMSWKCKYVEPIAKIHRSEKTMILGRLARAGKACPNRTDGGLPNRASEEMRMKDASKGRFYARKNFAIGSKT